MPTSDSPSKKTPLENTDPLVRAKAAREWPVEDQAALERLATQDTDPRVRQVAVRRLKSSTLVLKVLNADADAHVRQEAQDRMFKALLSSEPEASSLFAETAPHLSDDELVRIAKEVHGETSARAVAFIRGPKALADVAKTARSHDVRIADGIIDVTPKHLDPVQSYSENEYAFIANIYQPPLQYHYLKRPYTLVPFGAVTVPQPEYLDARGRPLPADRARKRPRPISTTGAAPRWPAAPLSDRVRRDDR